MNEQERKLLFEISWKTYNNYYDYRSREMTPMLGYADALVDLQRLIISKLCGESLGDN